MLGSTAMADKFSNFTKLANARREGVDYRICSRPIDDSLLLIIAPHGGKIEKGTSELANAIAGSDHSLYLFEGMMRNNNRDLHITSHNFDEPRALEMISNCHTAIGIHGRRDCRDSEGIYLGGLDEGFKSHIDRSLREAGYATKIEGHKFLANCPDNICNRGQTKKGVQMELPLTLRGDLLDDMDQLKKMADAIRAAINTHPFH
jgi:phage replication-related protein YjqB (UPF0714/DUF867 family)